jgi:hypothetical protein
MPKGAPRRSAPRKHAVIELDELTQDFKIHKNLTQDVIMTTQDKLRLALIEHRDVLASRREWVSAATLSLSLLTTLTLTQFQDRLGLSADTWRALYALSFMAAVFWLGSALLRLYRNRHRSDIDYLIKQIKEVGRMENSDGLD